MAIGKEIVHAYDKRKIQVLDDRQGVGSRDCRRVIEITVESDDSSYTYPNLTPALIRNVKSTRKISSVSPRSFSRYVIGIKGTQGDEVHAYDEVVRGKYQRGGRDVQVEEGRLRRVRRRQR